MIRPEDMTAKVWEKIEASFRLFAFHTVYDNSKQPWTHRGCLLRFVEAIVGSAYDIPPKNVPAVLRWWNEHRVPYGAQAVNAA